MTIRAPLSSFSNGIYPAEGELNMSMPKARDEIFAQVRPLRAYAILLVGDRARADDLAEETLRKAWGDFASFQRGGNLRTWLFTILRDAFSSKLRNAERGLLQTKALYLTDQPCDLRAALRIWSNSGGPSPRCRLPSGRPCFWSAPKDFPTKLRQ